MKLVNNWQRGWRWFSVQADMLPLAMTSAWLTMPPEWKETIPERWLLYMAMAFFVLGTIGRMVKQEKDDVEKTD